MKQFLEEHYSCCRLCPRKCGVNRLKGQKGYCGMPAQLYAARGALHMWEEPCLSGTEGSGTIFFTGCSLRCVFCQNYSIARGDVGVPITAERLVQICLELQDKGANNINLVTAAHYVPHIVQAITEARRQGLQIPIVYNSSGYECAETLRMLEGIVNIYLPDFKYMSPKPAAAYCAAPDYSERAKEALAEMVRQAGVPKWDEKGHMVQGVIVRHLVLPGWKEDSKKVIEYLYHTYGDIIYISIMNQYTPLPHAAHIPPLNRRLTTYEYNQVVDYAVELGVTRGYVQKGKTAAESFIPEFNCEGI